MLALAAPSVLVPWAIVVVLFLGAAGLVKEKKDAEVRAIEAEFERERVAEHARSLMVPLGWTWDEVAACAAEEPQGGAAWSRLRVYLVAAYTELQRALLHDDVQMTEAMEWARRNEPPRRLPKYPQIPPYLADAADVAGVPQGIIQVERTLTPRQAETVADGFAHGLKRPDLAPLVERYFVADAITGTEWSETTQEEFDAWSGPRQKVTPMTPVENLPEELRQVIFPPPASDRFDVV